MVKYTLEQRIFLFETYVKNKSYKSCKTKFRRKFPGVRVPASSTIFELVKKVRTTGSFLDKKYARQNTVLTEEKLDEIRVRLENSPRKSLSLLSQQVQVSTSTAWRATKKLHTYQLESETAAVKDNILSDVNQEQCVKKECPEDMECVWLPVKQEPQEDDLPPRDLKEVSSLVMEECDDSPLSLKLEPKVEVTVEDHCISLDG